MYRDAWYYILRGVDLQLGNTLSRAAVQAIYLSFEEEMKRHSVVYASMTKEQIRVLNNIQQHHLIPRHEGGSDEKSNIIYITFENYLWIHFWRFLCYNKPEDCQVVHLNIPHRSVPSLRKQERAAVALGQSIDLAEKAYLDLPKRRDVVTRPDFKAKATGNERKGKDELRAVLGSNRGNFYDAFR